MGHTEICLPIGTEELSKLRIGTQVLLSGYLYTARDAAHQRMVRSLEHDKGLPFSIVGETIYYAGPSPTPPGKVIGSIGPTTAARMDDLTPPLLAAGLKVTIGKGPRSDFLRHEFKRYWALYLATYGGAGALLAQCVKSACIICYEDLGPEAVMRLEVLHFPAIVANDIYGGDLFREQQLIYRR